ncbi:MAG: hypothetical protein WA005_15740 [Candidatus Binataceae bacterium]
MKTITSNSRPLRRTVCILLMCIAALAGMAQSARAQLYVGQDVSNIYGTVGKYTDTTGVPINANFITGLTDPEGLALSGNHLLVASYANGTVGEYNATTGELINANFITGLSYPYVLVVAGNHLFVTNSKENGTVGEYNATTGAPIQPNFITGLSYPEGLALSGNYLFVASDGNDLVGEYNATTGGVINANFITGLSDPEGLALSGNHLLVAIAGNGTVGEYNATTGQLIDANFITGLSSPNQLVVAGPPPSCTLEDTVTYGATSRILTMKFTIGNTIYSAATWNAWLTYQHTIKSLFSVSQPITNPPKAITKTYTDLPEEGEVGVLSTLTTPTEGIVCSSWEQTNTGTP